MVEYLHHSILGGSNVKAKIREITYKDIEIEDGQLLTQKEAAEILNVTIRAIRNHMDSGNLPTVVIPPKTWRYTLRDAVLELAEKKE